MQVTDTFFAVDESGKIVGIIDFMHELKGFLVDFGHTGYSVRPSERKKGYATQMLSLIMQVAKEAGLAHLQLSVERTNEPSVKTIIRDKFFSANFEK
ncbi:MAG: GNAT family N-acetyltransferase [Lachnospiraceae bacterium]|nr:GNAT family N-acetyltransferase [Lachnospiraceae bacterium]